ncbi:MAG TPA: NAD(P)-dependent oxidoreductase [Gammaproteobacteria bacterium]|nr:NAD(P)-dependent oxidoreductase [Gammaproteobacteria bacterium]
MREKKPGSQGAIPSSIALSEKRNGDLSSTQGFFKPEEYKIPTLSLLDDMVEIIKTQVGLPDLSNTVFIGVQHVLETTVTLFDALIALGVKPYNMFFSGKCYSTSPVIEAQVKKRGIHLMPSNKPLKPGEYEEYCQRGIAKMWRNCMAEINGKPIDAIIILDEGGRCLENIPSSVGLNYRIAAIEQTRGGLYTESVSLLPFPLIEVATCAVKKILEPPLIAEAIINVVIRKVRNLLASLQTEAGKTTFGIIGNGAIGGAITKLLLSLGYTVAVYDESESAFQQIIDKSFFRMENVDSVIAIADIIFGCTGKDITSKVDLLKLIKKDKTFISCTSEDKEFKTLLRSIGSQSIVPIDTLSDIVCYTKNGRTITVLQGGFPINFDRNPWNVPANSIEVTQGLLLGGCLQAILCATKAINDGKTINHIGSRQALHPLLQKYVAIHWLKRQKDYAHLEKNLAFFSDVQAIEKNSGGIAPESVVINRAFEKADPVKRLLPRSKL